MHELQLTQNILETVLAYARENNAVKVLRIHLIIGALHDFQREWIQRYFDYLSKDSLAEGAEITVHPVKAEFRCSSCDLLFNVDLGSVDRVRCPGCKGEEVHLERGQEFFIRDMEVV